MADMPVFVDHHDERFALPFTYGGLLPEDSTFERSQVVILPIPYEQTTTYGTGTKEGPHALIAASRHMELYDEELDYEVYQVGLHTLREVETIASGPQAMLDRITEVTRELLAHGKFVVGLGGEHTISFGLVRAYAERFPGLSVLQFDAHADLRDTYQGTPYNHASVLRRISEIVPAVQVGIRSLSREEAAWVKARETRLFYASEVVGSLSIATAISEALTDEVYITLCLDGLDPSIMPAVGTPEPGGLGWYDVLRIVRRVAETRHIVGFDVVELFPIPGNIAPDFLAAKLVYKVLGYRFKLGKARRG
ncbi:MAG TPA: agmatinase [Candidatus Tectomicrobia bacterium]|nr:agmatinase [Candidatus Tectomicrobia bacterium]